MIEIEPTVDNISDELRKLHHRYPEVPELRTALDVLTIQTGEPVEVTGLAEEPAHVYLSTACLHGFHDRCRMKCKFCQADCFCQCHTSGDAQ